MFRGPLRVLPLLLSVAWLMAAAGALLDQLFPPDLSRLATVGTEVLDRHDRPLALLPAPGGVWRFRTDAAHVAPVLTGVFIIGFSTILTGVNFIVTVHTLRAKNITWMRIPLFVWTVYGTSIIQVLATPVLGLAWAYVALRVVHSGIHCTYNRVKHRFFAFAASNLVLWALWVVLAVQLLR